MPPRRRGSGVQKGRKPQLPHSLAQYLETGGFAPGHEQPRRLPPTRVTVNPKTGAPAAEVGGAAARPGRSVSPSGTLELGGPPQKNGPSPPKAETHLVVSDILKGVENLVSPRVGRTSEQTREAAARLGVDPGEPDAEQKGLDAVAKAFGGDLARVTQAPKLAVAPNLAQILVGATDLIPAPKSDSPSLADLRTPVFTDEGPQHYAQAEARNLRWAKPGPEETPLTPREEQQFRRWVAQNGVPFDPDAKQNDYDMRGYWKATGGKSWEGPGKHFPDMWKTVRDTTFSDQSRYANGRNPLVWRGNKLVNKRTGQVVFAEQREGGKGKSAAALSALSAPARALIAEAHLPGHRNPKTVGPAGLDPKALRSIGINDNVRTRAGSGKAIDQYLGMAGWKRGDKQAELKALTAYYGTGDPESRSRALSVWNRIHGKGDQRQGAGQGSGNPADPLGKKTLGNVTVAELAQAAKEGTLKISAKGILSAPAKRQVLANLIDAHRALQASRKLGPAKEHGTLTPEEIGSLLVEEGNKLGVHLTPDEVAEGIGVAEAESAGNADEQRQLAEFSDPEEAHIGLFAEEGSGQPGVGFGTVPERLNARDAARSAIERFVDDERSWNPAWVHWQEIQGENETGADRAPQYRALAKELVQGGKYVDPEAVKNLVDAKHAARKAGINPTPWNGDVVGGDGEYVYVRADAKGAVNWAQSAVGTQQGSARQLHWATITHGPEDPWCAEFTTAAMLRQGLPMPAEPAYAGTYLNWKGGTNLGTDTSKLKPGDILVFGPPGGRAEHVGIYKGDGVMISGNYSDEVAESSVAGEIASTGLQGIVQPHFKGGKLKIRAGSLPGSSAGSVPGSEGASGGFEGEYSGIPGAEGAAPAIGEGRRVSAGPLVRSAILSGNPLATPVSQERRRILEELIKTPLNL